MKIAVASGVCCLLALSLTAFADKAEKPHYKKNGDLCTAEEIANPPVVTVVSLRSTYKMKVVCLTKSEWTIENSAKADKQRYEALDRTQTYSAAPTSPAAAASGAEAALSQ